jgi:hypothetical protein
MGIYLPVGGLSGKQKPATKILNVPISGRSHFRTFSTSEQRKKGMDGHPATLLRTPNQTTKEDFTKMQSITKFFISTVLLCATVVALNAQGQHAKSVNSSGPTTSSSVILCQPGFVYRCSSLGCFCVRP